MGIIRELPTSVINQIAAGEVVERPASVVKELLENAIDAGAKRIDLEVERGGKDLIRVADDGRGMDPDDLRLAFLPHATSKLATAEDLAVVRTLGFRGEALAAIAEVSRVHCQSRPHDAEVGHEIEIEAGRAGEIRECGCRPGTVIEVRNLFHNTPVRRGFLKSDSTEAGHVAEMFTRIALAHWNVHLTMRSGGRILYDLPPASGMKERVAVFFGQELADALLWVENRVGDFHLRGYVAHPSQSRSSNKGQYLFVGSRYVRDRSLAHALTEAYRGLLMVGRMPVAFLFLDLPPEEVDVNVHPTKVEVRFRDSSRVYSQLLGTLRQTFLRSDLHSRLQVPSSSSKSADAASAPVAAFASPVATTPGSESVFPGLMESGESIPNREQVASWFQPASVPERQEFTLRAPATPQKTTSPLGFASNSAAPDFLAPRPEPTWATNLPPRSTSHEARFDEFVPALPGSVEPTLPVPSPEPEGVASQAESGQPEAGSSNENAPLPALRPLTRAIQVHDSYLIAEDEQGVMVIDQHALHERILFEEIKARVERGGIESQRLLVPEPVELPPDEAHVLLERRDALARIGLEVEPFGGGTILVTSVPAMLGRAEPERLIRDVAEHLASKPLDPLPAALLNDVMSLMACKGAVKAGQRLTDAEIEALLSRRHLANDAHHCPHGRPTALILSKEELERQFGRI